jgi:hypothetical protein
MIGAKNEGSRILFGLRLSGELYPRPIVDTWHHLRYRYPRSTWPERSLRKQVCLLYIQWLCFPEKENRSELIEKVKAWRKIDGRIGGERSVLEKLVRRFFAKDKKERRSPQQKKSSLKTGKNALKNKTGIHSPEMVSLVQTPEVRAKGHETQRRIRGDHWFVFCPNGDVLEIHNLKRFCRENNLDASHLTRTAKYSGKIHKGYRARKRCVDLEGYTPGFEPKKGKK